MRCIVKMDVLKEKSKELSDYNNENVKTKIEELDKAFDNITWRGKSKKTFLDCYRSKIAELSKITTMIDFYSSFMEKASTNYTEANEEAIEEWKKVFDQMLRDEEAKKNE